MKQVYSVILTVIFWTGLATAQESFPAPFGLGWDMSVSELKALGFHEIKTEGGLTTLTSVSAPKPWSQAEVYIALTYDDRLIKAGVKSVDFTDDIYGIEGKQTYKRMKTLLTGKYGMPTEEFELTGQELYKDSDEFYQCLDYSGCGSYASFFRYAGGVIQLQLQGQRRGVGHVLIYYESPAFGLAKRKIEADQLEADTDAL